MRLLAARPRPAHAAGARLRDGTSRDRRPVARHGLAGDPRPDPVRAGQSAGRRLVRRADDDLRPRRGRTPCSRRIGRAGPASVGPGGRGPGRSLLSRSIGRRRSSRSTAAWCRRAEAPRDWDDVLEPRWFDKVLIRDPMASGTMRAIWGLIIERSLRTTGDTAAGMAWLRRLDGQTKAYALNPAILDARLARAEGLVTPVGSAGHPHQPVEGHAVRLRLSPERHGGHRRRDRPGARQPAPRCRAGLHRLRRERRRRSSWPPRRSTASRRATTCPRAGSPPGSRRSSARWWWPTWTGRCSRGRAPPGWATGTATSGAPAGRCRR